MKGLSMCSSIHSFIPSFVSYPALLRFSHSSLSSIPLIHLFFFFFILNPYIHPTYPYFLLLFYPFFHPSLPSIILILSFFLLIHSSHPSLSSIPLIHPSHPSLSSIPLLYPSRSSLSSLPHLPSYHAPF